MIGAEIAVAVEFSARYSKKVTMLDGELNTAEHLRRLLTLIWRDEPLAMKLAKKLPRTSSEAP